MTIIEEIAAFLEHAREEGRKPLLAIVGPTAAGKTALSLKMAEKFDGEIISADSRQVYKHMDIGTDKIPPAARKNIPHHMIDVVEPNREFTVADFKRMATQAISDIHRRNRVPILCGGTGLYINVITQDYQLPDVPPNEELREELRKILEQKGPVFLHGILQEKDMEVANKIHPNNVPYVIRALEILDGGAQKINQKREPKYDIFIIGIDWPKEVLYQKINSRVDELMENGLLNEVKTLLMKGYNAKMPSLTSLGYLELIQFLEGHVTLEEAVEEIKKNTRNYCKRQMTWFRRDKNIHWIQGEDIKLLLES